jgi:hypothetical protein
MAEAKWRIKPFRFFAARGASAKYHAGVTSRTGPAPSFERHPFRAGIVGEGTNIDIP